MQATAGVDELGPYTRVTAYSYGSCKGGDPHCMLARGGGTGGMHGGFL